MTEEMQTQEVGKGPKKRNIGRKKGSKARKKIKMVQGSGEKVKIDKKMKKLFEKRARDYNSDDDESAPAIGDISERLHDKKEEFYTKSSDEEGEDQRNAAEEDEVSGDEEGELQPGITKFTEGCKAFRMAFKKIMKMSISHDVLGPILSAQKKLVAEKLADDEAERKVKGEAKKEKHLVREKGHVKPSNYLDSHEKFLIGVATKGVVKLFNAVNKAQNAQKGLNPSRFKDEKVLRKRRKEAFISELRKPSSQSASTVQSAGPVDVEGPGWAPLRDNYMLTTSKLKNWDKMPDTTVSKDFGTPVETSSDED